MATTLKTQTASVASAGGASGAYTYRLQAVLNSTDTNANTANITVTFAVQGNNGYYYSSWQDEDATFTISTNNSFSTTNNGATTTGIRGYKTTAAGSYTTLSTWTGNISYKSDGTLTLSASVTYGWQSGSYVPKETTISFSNVTITSITPSTVRYTGTPVGTTYTQNGYVARYNGTSGSQYYFRVMVNETKYEETVATNGAVTRTSTLQLTLQFRNNTSSSSNWWSSTAASLQPKAELYFNGNKIGNTGYVRSAAQAYKPSTSWAAVPNIGTQTVTVVHSANGYGTATCGFKITAGTGAYSQPYGPASVSNTQAFRITTHGGHMLQPPYTITYDSNGGSACTA